MNKRLKFLLVCLTVLFAFSTLTVYARYDLGFQWPNVPSTILWYCGELTASQRQAAQAAMNTWNAVHATDGSALITSSVTSDMSENSIGYTTASDIAIAKTIETLDPNGYIESMRIVLQSYADWSIGASPGAYDVQSVIVHELGHAYGIAHCHEGFGSCDVIGCPNNVMSPSISKNSTRRVLQTYDIINYQYIYVS
jgi:hypothetical protein